MGSRFPEKNHSLNILGAVWVRLGLSSQGDDVDGEYLRIMNRHSGKSFRFKASTYQVSLTTNFEDLEPRTLSEAGSNGGQGTLGRIDGHCVH